MNDFKRILIADSGATKTDWVCLTEDTSGACIMSESGSGLSPLHHPADVILSEFKQIEAAFGNQFNRIRFYGAGISTPDLESEMECLLNSIFIADDIKASSDVLGAAKAIYGKNPGVACIMGTGSSSCHYDGHRIDFRVPALGYLVDDDGGGVAFGRRLLADVFKGIAPVQTREAFHHRYGLTKEQLIEHLYKEPSPNRWMASFFPFIAEHIDNPYISELIDSQIERFISREFAAYPANILIEEGIGFAGSVANILKTQLKEKLNSRGWRVGLIVRKPIECIGNLSS